MCAGDQIACQLPDEGGDVLVEGASCSALEDSDDSASPGSSLSDIGDCSFESGDGGFDIVGVGGG